MPKIIIGSYYCFSAEHICNANGGAMPKFIKQRKTIKYSGGQTLRPNEAPAMKLHYDDTK